MSALTRKELEARATYWDWRNEGTLIHTTLSDALIAWMEDRGKGGTMLEMIAAAGPATIDVYERNAMTPKHIGHIAGRVLDDLLENIECDDDFGTEDGIDLTPEEMAACKEKAVALVAELCKYYKPYWCSVIGSVTLETDDIESELRAIRPDWFPAVTP